MGGFVWWLKITIFNMLLYNNIPISTFMSYSMCNFVLWLYQGAPLVGWRMARGTSGITCTVFFPLRTKNVVDSLHGVSWLHATLYKRGLHCLCANWVWPHERLHQPWLRVGLWPDLNSVLVMKAVNVRVDVFLSALLLAEFRVGQASQAAALRRCRERTDSFEFWFCCCFCSAVFVVSPHCAAHVSNVFLNKTVPWLRSRLLILSLHPPT